MRFSDIEIPMALMRYAIGHVVFREKTKETDVGIRLFIEYPPKGCVEVLSEKPSATFTSWLKNLCRRR
jgi:hypothetical protein